MPDPARATLQLANSETGVVQDLPDGLAVSDLTQGFGKLPVAFNWLGVEMGFVSAHKLGGPKGVGALVMRRARTGRADPRRRSGNGPPRGTENIIGIAGFGAAAEAAQRDLADGVWDRVAEIRNILEKTLDEACRFDYFCRERARRLPNTLCLATPGWKGETQVMQMDLAGFAVSAGSACSSGKARAFGRAGRDGV